MFRVSRYHSLLFHFPLVNRRLFSLAVFELYCVGRGESGPALGRSGGGLWIQDIWLHCRWVCAQIFDCWTAHPEARLSSNHSRYNGAWEKEEERVSGEEQVNSRDKRVLCSVLPYGRSTEGSLALTSSLCNVLFHSSHNLISCWCCVALEMAQW